MLIRRAIVGASLMLASVSGAAAADWTGFYAGVLGGGSAEQSGGGFFDMEATGGIAGAFAGYNFAAGTIVVGPEVAVLATSAALSHFITVSDFGGYNLSDTQSRGPALLLNGRAALPIGDWLLSVSGGIATAESTFQRVATYTNGDPYPSFNFDGTARHIGFNIGAGVDVQLTERVALGVEVRHIDFGTQTYQFQNDGSGDIWLTEQTAHLRLSVALD